MARQGLSIEQSLLDRAKAARPIAATNFSAYVRDLVTADLDGIVANPVADRQILVSLIEQLDPLAAEDMRAALESRADLDQRKVLQLFLTAYLRAVRPAPMMLEEGPPSDPVLERAATALAALAERGKTSNLPKR